MIVKTAFGIFTVCSIFHSLQSYGYHGQSRHHDHDQKGLEEVFAWKQLTYNFNDYLYVVNADAEGGLNFHDPIPEAERYFIQYNNVPIGFEVHRNKVFVTVPRRRYGIPSTLNYMELDSDKSPHLKPYPSVEAVKSLVSVYRPRIDECGRLWMVDTGLLEVPGERKQVKPPAIVVYDLKTDKEVLRYTLKTTDLVDERTPAGLTSITIDVSRKDCNSAFAYITDLASNGIIVFSMKAMDSWRIQDSSFEHDPKSLNFTVDGNIINWKDGIFSVTLSGRRPDGHSTAYYHPLVSTTEYTIDTKDLKNPANGIRVQELGIRGNNTQSGSHVYHGATNTILYANLAQDAILCWNIDKPLVPRNVVKIAQDHEKLVYISDLKISGDYVWVLSNQIPNFVFSTLNPNEINFYIQRGRIQDLIKGTRCETK